MIVASLASSPSPTRWVMTTGARARSLAALKSRPRKGQARHQAGGPSVKQVRDVAVPEAITVQELANRMAERGCRHW
jgi:translation initiation factor IF-2